MGISFASVFFFFLSNDLSLFFSPITLYCLIFAPHYFLFFIFIWVYFISLFFRRFLHDYFFFESHQYPALQLVLDQGQVKTFDTMSSTC